MNLIAKIKKGIVLLAIIAFLSLVFFGMGTLSMPTKADGQMLPCPFVGIATLCKMSPLEHVGAWQNMLTVTYPQKAAAFALLTLLVLSLVIVGVLKRNLLLFSNYYATRWCFYKKQNSYLSFSDSLKEAFSRGILNTKAY